MFFSLPEDLTLAIQLFDFMVCIILLLQWFISFYNAEPTRDFLKDKNTWIDLVASIPFDAILPVIIPQVNILRYLRLLKLVRVFALFKRFFNNIQKFLQKSNLDKILGGVIFTVIIFTLILYIYGPSYGLFDDFYFVIVTLTTVGYGDVTPITFNEKIIAIVLIIIGIFIFSTITAAISSFLTERLLEEDEEDTIGEIKQTIEKKSEDIMAELENVRRENKQLKDEINELKETINKK